MSVSQRIIIVGGGAAGFFAAIRIAESRPDCEVIILERGKEVLQKVRISGGGRCNLAHACYEPRPLTSHYPRGQRELLGPFHQFCSGDTIDWFEKRGVATHTEADGRIFPVTNSSQTVIDCFLEAASAAGVIIRRQTRVVDFQPQDGKWDIQLQSGESLIADQLLIATGSNPRIWTRLGALGHTIVPPVPSLFTFNIKDERLQDLAGISVPFATIKVLGEKLEDEGPLLITHWGVSGPAVLRLSAWGARQLNERGYEFEIELDWTGGEDVAAAIEAARDRDVRKQIMNTPLLQLPARLWKKLVAAASIPAAQRWADLSKKQRLGLIRELGAGRYHVTGKSTFKEEFVTAGGINLSEVNFKTFESKLHPGLFFAGEVLNIDAVTGGFNFQAAWTGGWIAAAAVAQ